MKVLFCSKCGSKVDPGCGRFCRQCGAESALAEPAILEKLANLFRGIEAVGGKMYLTSKGVCFSSHSLNLQTGDTYIPLGEIDRIEKCNTLGIVPNGLRIVTKRGEAHQFVLWGRNAVIACLNLLWAQNGGRASTPGSSQEYDPSMEQFDQYPYHRDEED